MSVAAPVLETSFNDLQLVRRGKVRDVYKLDDDHLLIVATDRISAFDCVLPTPIARKGEVLTALSRFWFEKLSHIVPHHLVTTEMDRMSETVQRHKDSLRGRSMLVRRTGEVCGHRLPEGLRESDQLPEAIFTPATKAEEGNDENISEARMSEILGEEVTTILRDISLRLYKEASEYARTRGIIIADTKFEFGKDKAGNIILIDEALTPDSSRF